MEVSKGTHFFYLQTSNKFKSLPVEMEQETGGDILAMPTHAAAAKKPKAPPIYVKPNAIGRRHLKASKLLLDMTCLVS